MPPQNKCTYQAILMTYTDVYIHTYMYKHLDVYTYIYIYIYFRNHRMNLAPNVGTRRTRKSRVPCRKTTNKTS